MSAVPVASPRRRTDDGHRLVDRLRRAAAHRGLVGPAITDASALPEARRELERRRSDGLSADMAFTYRNPERSTSPTGLFGSVTTLVVCAMPYRRGVDPPRPSPSSARVASYARGDRYGELRAALGAVAEVLRSEGHRTRVVADENALVDRSVAARAGLGWLGRNTSLITASGAEVLLGAVATDAPLPLDGGEPPGSCGPCHVCETSCPTGALRGGRLDARRCLAWLVQAPGPIPLEFRSALGDRLYGCDDCTVVCPPSRRAGVGRAREAKDEPAPDEIGAWVDAVEILHTDDDTLLERFGRWYLPGRNPDSLRRNAAVVLGNAPELSARARAGLLTALHRGSDLVAEHAAWALARHGMADVVAATPRPAPRREPALTKPGVQLDSDVADVLDHDGGS